MIVYVYRWTQKFAAACTRVDVIWCLSGLWAWPHQGLWWIHFPAKRVQQLARFRGAMSTPQLLSFSGCQNDVSFRSRDSTFCLGQRKSHQCTDVHDACSSLTSWFRNSFKLIPVGLPTSLVTASVPFAEMLAALFFHLFSGLAGCGGYRRCKVKYTDTHCVGLCVRPKHKSENFQEPYHDNSWHISNHSNHSWARSKGLFRLAWCPLTVFSSAFWAAHVRFTLDYLILCCA